LEARRVAGETGQAYISPYNDPEVVAGQGTLGVELQRQLPEVDAVLVSVGGGGLIAGIGSYLKEVKPNLRLVGCLPLNSPVMYECVRAGRILDYPCLPTLSDGTAGGLEPGSITFDMCRDMVDEWHLVTEEEIQAAMRLMIVHHHMIVEGAAAVSVAALLKNRERYRGLNVAVVICGGNVDADTVRRILDTES
jgi:threonine dehydratase